MTKVYKCVALPPPRMFYWGVTRLLAEVKAREDEIIGLKEERSRLQARVYQVQLEKKDLAIERDIAREELVATQVQLSETSTQLATIAEEKNGRPYIHQQIYDPSIYFFLRHDDFIIAIADLAMWLFLAKEAI